MDQDGDRVDQGGAGGRVEMKPLLLPFVFNIVPIGLMTLLGGECRGQLACQGKSPESEGFRTILGSLWTANLLGSILGLIFPVQMSPPLLIQMIYITLWLLMFVMPRLLKGKISDIPSGIALVFLVIVLSYRWEIPWGAAFRNSMNAKWEADCDQNTAGN